MPNVDDDDLDGLRDCDDGKVNGPLDREDLTEVLISFPVVREDITISGPGRSLFNIVRIEPTQQGTSLVLIEATGPRSKRSSATVAVRAGKQRHSFALDVRPFLLTSSLHRATTVFVVEIPSSLPFVSSLNSILGDINNGPDLSVVPGREVGEGDVWVQDTTEIGAFTDSTMSVAIHGLRGQHYTGPPSCNAGPLDRYFARQFLRRNRGVFVVGESLPNRKWIDWFGNLEVSPPVSTAKASYPYGRILTGRQGNLSMHPRVMAFLEAQGSQWPPVTLDTGFLAVGHVDEIINFVPATDGFKVLLASPRKGRQLIEQLSEQGNGDATLLSGKKAEVSVAQILANRKLMAANAIAENTMLKNRRLAIEELGLKEQDIVDVPVMFNESGLSVWPNIVNGLVVNNNLVCPCPFGPRLNGDDVIEAEFRRLLLQTLVTTHFVDVYEAYSLEWGECHCGTNAIREPILRK